MMRGRRRTRKRRDFLNLKTEMVVTSEYPLIDDHH
jgi:hypothetical protein